MVDVSVAKAPWAPILLTEQYSVCRAAHRAVPTCSEAHGSLARKEDSVARLRRDLHTLIARRSVRPVTKHVFK
jgi:hypothetical protein